LSVEHDEIGADRIGAAPGDCTDQLLHQASAEMPSDHSDGSDLGPPTLLLPGFDGARESRPLFSCDGADSVAVPYAQRLHRTIVLLL
jgi:hypothetical protein